MTVLVECIEAFGTEVSVLAEFSGQTAEEAAETGAFATTQLGLIIQLFFSWG